MQTYQLVYSNKVNHRLIYQKSVQPPKDFLSTPTWSQLHCLETNMATVTTLCENALYTRCISTLHAHLITCTFAFRAGVDGHIHANAILSSPFWYWFRTRANT